MIFGIGIDLIEVDRIAEMVERWGDKFLTKIFTEAEISHCKRKYNKSECFAARFAAKEALAKALGHGRCKHFYWTDVEVTRARSGKPSFKITGVTEELVIGKRVQLSMTHIKSHAAAIAIVEDESK